MPIPDAKASPKTYLIFLCSLPACQRSNAQSRQSISFGLRATLLPGKSFLICPLSGLAPSGAWVEGLIQAARRRLSRLNELPPPALSGPVWPGGVISSVMDYLHFWKSLEQPRGPFFLFPP